MLKRDLGRDLLGALRRATIVLLIDRLAQLDCDDTKALASTWGKVTRAAQSCDLIDVADAQEFRSAIGTPEWRSVVSLIEHQLSYLRMVEPRFNLSNAVGKDPRVQVTSDPESYAGFLAGVAASHIVHAKFVASIAEIEQADVLVDLGGGFGAYALGWIASRTGRTAVLSDLPGVQAILPLEIAENQLIKFIDLDLLNFPLVLPIGEVYLLANVLHLFQNWADVVREIAKELPSSAKLVVMEASLNEREGALFDLQVHIRSGFVGGLIDHNDLIEAAERAGLAVERDYRVTDEEDIFRRGYHVTVFAPLRN